MSIYPGFFNQMEKIKAICVIESQEESNVPSICPKAFILLETVEGFLEFFFRDFFHKFLVIFKGDEAKEELGETNDLG